MNKNRIITILGFLISIILLYFSLKDIRFKDIYIILKNADYRLVLIPTCFILLAALFSSFKWSRIAGGNVRIKNTFVALIIGLFINNVLPARIGEIVRGYVLSKKEGLSFSFALSTVLIDRLFDLIGLLIITFVFFPKQNLPHQISNAIYLLIMLLIICVAVFILFSNKRAAKIISDKLCKAQKPIFAKIGRRLYEIQENLNRIRSPLTIIYYIIIAFIQWLCMSCALYFVTLVIGLSLDFFYIPFICALLNMGIAVPSSPGYIGVYQFILVYLLAIFGISKSQGFTTSILFHASWYIPYNIMGFFFLLKEHIKIKELKKIKNNS
ncbi:MAG TPA: lysylphosphatidylglycerol synthase transmembrane domain-containing protein [Syntrophorhabdaceae bacterium]|nr:lysylphosphatidylglycerol synthase transmembrane domain-containing protein [Syntrophorhabdaceae bacterium]